MLRGSSEWLAPDFEAAASYLTRMRLFAGGTGVGLLDHVQNSTEVVPVRSLQRRTPLLSVLPCGLSIRRQRCRKPTSTGSELLKPSLAKTRTDV